MKRSLVLFFLFLSIILLASGCVNKQETQQEDKQISSAVITEDENKQDAENDSATTTEITKEFSMTAKNWEFEPSQINVDKGDMVKLKIKSIDVKHGFSIPEFNINADLNPGEETIVEFKADKLGTFTFSCSVYCGSGHKDMKGTLIVK